VNTKKTWQDARPGDRIRFQNPQDAGERDGVVTMKLRTHLVLNCGGSHGTPGLVDSSNFRGFGRRKASEPKPVVLTPWEEKLKEGIVAKIKIEQADGTVGMGLECFGRGLKIPQTQGCPRGTNSWWAICQSIRKVFSTLGPKDQAFILP
jgi:hypothetical protein